jgi:PAS domain S-box-containing protein
MNAEALVKNLAPNSTAPALEILMHELMVHKVELEMQNEELKSTQNIIEESRDRYVDYYEFSPVGFITLSRDGLINKINLTACLMLGVERFRVMSRRLSSYVAAHEKDRWHRLFMHIMAHTETENQAFDLEMSRDDGTLFYAYFNCIKWETSASDVELRIVLTDITKLKDSCKLTA